MHHGASVHPHYSCILHPAALGLFQVAAQDVLSNVTNDGLQSAKVQSTHASMYCEQSKLLHEGRIHERNMFNEVLSVRIQKTILPPGSCQSKELAELAWCPDILRHLSEPLKTSRPQKKHIESATAGCPLVTKMLTHCVECISPSLGNSPTVMPRRWSLSQS